MDDSQQSPVSRIAASELRPPERQPRIPELDAIRAIAVLSVMFGHLLVTTPVITRTPSGLPHIVEMVLNHGWLGVDVFFLLSGMLITTILLSAKRHSPGRFFGYFYERRALRIWPLYFLMLAIEAIAYVPITGWAYFALCVGFIANFAPMFHVAVPNGGGPLWSLAVEEQFYLFWPVLVLLLNRRKMVVVLLAIVVAVPVLRMLHPGEVEYTWFRCDGLAWGALLALWFTSPRRSRRGDDRLAGALLIGAALAFLITIPFGGLHLSPIGSATRITEVVCVFAALMVFAVSRSGSRETRFLRGRFALVTAELSYCLYLIHVPLVDLYQTAVARFAPTLAQQLGPLEANLLRAGVVLLAAYGLAALSRRYIELPFLNMGRRARAETAPAAAAATATGGS